MLAGSAQQPFHFLPCGQNGYLVISGKAFYSCHLSNVNIFGVSLCGKGLASAIFMSDEKANASPNTNACCCLRLVNKSIWLLSSYSIVFLIKSKSRLFVIL